MRDLGFAPPRQVVLNTKKKRIKSWFSGKTNCSCKKPNPPNNVYPSEATKEPSLLLILKWGGELTPSGRSQAEELGKVFRCMYPGGQGKLSPLHILSLTTKERSGFETQHGRLAITKNVAHFLWSSLLQKNVCGLSQTVYCCAIFLTRSIFLRTMFFRKLWNRMKLLIFQNFEKNCTGVERFAGI